MKGLKSNGELQQRLRGVFPGRTPDADPFQSHSSQRTAQQAKLGAASTFIGIFSEWFGTQKVWTSVTIRLPDASDTCTTPAVRRARLGSIAKVR